MKSYTVILLYPNYIAENYGEEIFVAETKANTPQDAAKIIQKEAAKAMEPTEVNPEDFLLLAVFKGNLTPELTAWDYV